MSLPGDPDTGGAQKDLRNSLPSDTAVSQTDPVLKYLAEQWSTPGIRWATVRHLRAFLLGKRGVTANVAAHLPKDFGTSYSNGRLTAVVAALAFELPSGTHMEMDWFAKSGVNWWKGTVDGAKAEDTVASKLLEFLELSCGLEASDPGNPTTWRWSDGSTKGNPADALDELATYGGPPNHLTIRLEWTWKDDPTDVTADYFKDGEVLVFQIKSPKPKRGDWDSAG